MPTRKASSLPLRAREDANSETVLAEYLLAADQRLERVAGMTRGSLTRAGNAHLRRVLVEAAWHYRYPPHRAGETIRKRRVEQPTDVIETARKAEVRLYRKFTRMVMHGKRTTVAAVAVARELAGFVWAIGRI